MPEDPYRVPPGAVASRSTMGAALDVVDADETWRALHAPLGKVLNLVDAAFTSPAAAWFFVDVALVRVALVAQLRQAPRGAGAGGRAATAEAARVDDVVGDLAGRSPAFRALWSGPRVAHRTSSAYEVRHPAVGRLRLRRRTSAAPDGSWHEHLLGTPRDATALSLLLLDPAR